jgi:AraC-like DNA-binding protein/quercetin dioxygenase-like cupin family protein
MKPAYKSVSLMDSRTFRVIRQENKQEFEFPWHYHPEFELTYISNSQGLRYVGNNIENFYENDLVLLGSNLPHCWINSEDQEESSKAVVIYLNEELVKWLSEDQFNSVRSLFNKSSQGVKFKTSVALKIKPKLDQLLQADPFEKYITLLQILQELSVTTEFDLLSQIGFSYELNSANNERINTVYEYVRNNYHKKISLADIAARVNMSEEYFSRFFSKSLMKSFFTFLNEYRINRACKLLIETERQVSEICYQVGYETIPFFYRQFKKIKNMPPQAYRAQYLSAVK